MSPAATRDGSDLGLAPGFGEVIAEVRDVLTVAEIAAVTGVKERQVHHWSSGEHAPKGEARRRLLVLHQVIGKLRLSLGSEQIKVWLFSPLPGSDGRPIDLLAADGPQAVLLAAGELGRRGALEDEYLVELARAGNSEAYDALVRRYRGLVRVEAAAQASEQVEFDDLVQEGLLGLYKAIRDHRQADGSFDGLAEARIGGQILAAVRRARATTPARPEGGPATETIDASVDRLISGLAGISASLTQLENQTLSLYLEGRSQAEIGEELGVSTGTIGHALASLKRKVGAQLAAREVDV